MKKTHKNQKKQQFSPKRSNPLFCRACQCLCRGICERDGVNYFV